MIVGQGRAGLLPWEASSLPNMIEKGLATYFPLRSSHPPVPSLSGCQQQILRDGHENHSLNQPGFILGCPATLSMKRSSERRSSSSGNCAALFNHCKCGAFGGLISSSSGVRAHVWSFLCRPTANPLSRPEKGAMAMGIELSCLSVARCPSLHSTNPKKTPPLLSPLPSGHPLFHTSPTSSTVDRTKLLFKNHGPINNPTLLG